MSKLSKILDEHWPVTLLSGNGRKQDMARQQIKELFIGLVNETHFAYKDATAYIEAEVIKEKIGEL